MMMGFGILIVVVFGVIMWRFIDKNNDANALYKEKRKVMPQTAQDIVYERYANDEITQEEYLTLLNDLEKSSQQYQ